MGSTRTALTGVALTVLVGLGVSACSADDDSDSAADVAPEEVADAPASEASDAGAGAASEGSETSGDAADTAAGLPSDAPLPTGQALATTAGVVVTTSDIRAAVDDTLTAAQRNGATVFTADVTIGEERDDGSVDGSGYFVVKVPPADLEPLIVDLGATVGRVSGRTQDTTDVTDQLVDLDIRISVERDVIARFQRLLVDATEFQDIVEIERVISERTISLEQLLASQRNLDNRVERSTLTIRLQYEAPVVDPTDDVDEGDGIADAWRDGWGIFVGALFTIGFVLAVAAPFLLTAVLVLAVVWLAIRGRRRARSASHPAAGLGADPLPTPTPDAGPNTDQVTDELTPDERLAGPTPRG
jgi:hypothetical protein